MRLQTIQRSSMFWSFILRKKTGGGKGKGLERKNIERSVASAASSTRCSSRRKASMELRKGVDVICSTASSPRQQPSLTVPESATWPFTSTNMENEPAIACSYCARSFPDYGVQDYHACELPPAIRKKRCREHVSSLRAMNNQHQPAPGHTSFLQRVSIISLGIHHLQALEHQS